MSNGNSLLNDFATVNALFVIHPAYTRKVISGLDIRLGRRNEMFFLPKVISPNHKLMEDLPLMVAPRIS